MKIGIMGGTFDPIHYGHLNTADHVRRQLSLDHVLFIPDRNPPHKTGSLVTAANIRYEMVKEAIKDYQYFSCSDIEIKREGLTYTYDTVNELRRIYSDDCLFYIILGTDSFIKLDKWYRYTELFDMCSFAVMNRAGYENSSLYEVTERYRQQGANICYVDVPNYDISSSEIRRRVIMGNSIEEYTTKDVERIIKENMLYKDSENDLFTVINNDLKSTLSEKRYRHSIGVMNESARLAHIFGADEYKCKLSGLLHDCARELDDTQMKWLDEDILKKEDYDGFARELLHAEYGAIIAKTKYNIQDGEVIEAIRCHTTGRPNMGMIARIVFIADYTEVNRIGPSFDSVRAVIKKFSDDKEYCMWAAMLEECNSSIMYCLDKKDTEISIETIRTRNWIVKNIKKK